MSKDKEGEYPGEYTNERHCYLRALHNVHKEAAMEGLEADIKHDATTKQGKVRAIAKIYEDFGKVFHNRGQHWVALRKVPESDERIIF